jgi:hypothetical protein
MLPRICYANQESIDPNSGKQGWHVDPLVTYNVKFFTTNQNENFDFEWIKRERTYHTMSFIYKVQNKNESIFFAYDEPYTYSQNLKTFMDGIRNDLSLQRILQVSTLCQSLGGNNVKLLTITENVEVSLTYYEMLQIHLKKDVRDRAMIKNEIEKLTPEEKMK